MTESKPLPLAAKPPEWPRDIATWPTAALPFRDLIEQNALRFDLRPELVCAVVEQESGWNTWGMRFEPAFYGHYVNADAGDETERVARACSWGLMQVMGQVAREAGFSYAFLSGLCEPSNGLFIGCSVLARKLKLTGGNVDTALLLWNGGGNKEYPAQVLARMEKYA